MFMLKQTQAIDWCRVYGFAAEAAANSQIIHVL